ncbi:metal-sensing transcriptional repressor [Actinoplanes sp. NPDC049599]|uniref:metal-sensing transcriptional repressor n=1 Tax=Actinoplanes sp. NPDC049599 TaxID=3363903 RepID=UPI0037AD1F97
MWPQLSAANRALQQVALGLLDDHMRHCVLDAARQVPNRRRKRSSSGIGPPAGFETMVVTAGLGARTH